MKCWYMLMAVLVSGLFSFGSVRAEEEDDGDDIDFEYEMQRVELDNKQLDFQERQAEFNFKNEMRKLELEKARLELDKNRQMLKIQSEMAASHRMESPAGRFGQHEGMGFPGRPQGPGMEGPVGRFGQHEGGNIPGRPQVPGQEKSVAPCATPSGCPLMGGHGGLPPCHKRGLVLFVLVTGLIHILLATWVYQDIRKRNTGSGVWILLSLIAGFIGTLVYALVRIGDKPAAA